MDKKKIISIIESILFVSSEKLSIDDILRIFNKDKNFISKREMKILLTEMIQSYEDECRGLELICIDNYYQLISKKNNNEYIESILYKKKKKTLSQAAFEVISIIAYKQPITKIEIDEIRGVKSDNVISNLISYGLIKEVGKLDKIGRPILYGTTHLFLSEFGLDRLEDLPKIDEIGEI